MSRFAALLQGLICDASLDETVSVNAEELFVPSLEVGMTLDEKCDAEEVEVRKLAVASEPTGYVPPERVYFKNGVRHKLLMTGVCERCAHCGMKLTDALSVERGTGPICSRSGYSEDPVNSDEIQAMIDLSEYPELVERLVAVYKPQGVRKMMNFLVRVCSLNRKSPVHKACCDAIESLGWNKLASKLRESLACISILQSKDDPNAYSVWAKKDDFSYSWWREIRSIPGWNYDKKNRLNNVPVVREVSHEEGRNFPPHAFVDAVVEGTERQWPAKVWKLMPADSKGNRVTVKAKLWELTRHYYAGMCATTPRGTVKIPELKVVT